MTKGVLIFPSYYEAICDLPDEDRLKLYDCIICYGLYGAEPELPVHLKGYFALIRPTMDRVARRYEAACDNGRRGGRPGKNQNHNQNINPYKEKEKEYDTQKEWERDTKGEPLNSDEEFERKRALALSALDRLEKR